MNDRDELMQLRRLYELDSRADIPRAEVPAPPISPTMDVIKSAPGAVGRGALGATMMLPNLMNAAVAGPQYLYEGLLGQDRPDFQPYQPFYGSNEVIGMLPESMQPYEPQTMAGKITSPILEFTSAVKTPALMQKAATIGQPKYTAEMVKQKAGETFKSVEGTGGELNQRWMDKTLRLMRKTPEQTAAGKQFAGQTKAAQMLDDFTSIGDRPLNFKSLQEIDKAMTRRVWAPENINPRTGMLNENGMQMLKMQSQFRASLGSAGKKDFVLPPVRTKADLKMANDELASLRNVEKDLMRSINSNAQTNPTFAAEEAKGLASIKQQIKAQEGVISGIKADIKNYPTEAARAGRMKQAMADLRKAQKTWAAQLKMNDLEDLIMRAEMSPQPANMIKSGIRSMLTSKSRRQQFTPEERKMLKKITDTNMLRDFVNTMGSRLIPVVAAGTGDITQAGALSAGSNLARSVSGKATMNRLNKVNQEIARNVMTDGAPITPYPMVNPSNYGIISQVISGLEKEKSQ